MRHDKSSGSAPDETATSSAASEKKGRPTPTRKEAEAAARERARAGMDKKAAKKLLREKQGERNRQMRAGIKAGDERYLPARDQGPVRRFVRDWVDSRITFSEFLLPLLIVLMALMYSGNAGLARVAGNLWSISILLLLVDATIVRFRLRNALRLRFPDESLRGTTFYALLRMIQLRFLRLPKPAVKLGQAPR